MQVRVLGPVEVRGDGGEPIPIGQRKVRELLSVLAVAGGTVSSEQLKAMLWVTAGTQDMLSALTTTVNRLRRLLPKDRLAHGEDGYRLVLDPKRDTLDVRDFRDLVATARRERTDSCAAATLFEKALGLWRDPRLPDLPGTPLVAKHAQRLLIERRDVIEALVETRMVLGRHSELALELPELLADDPLNEHLWLAWLLALYRAGRKAAALRAYEDARLVYLTKVGAEPSLPLRRTRDRIAVDASGLTWSSDQTVQENRAIMAGADMTVVSGARIYDYLLGGKNNFEVDRTAAEAMLRAVPDLRESAHDHRRFLCRAVRLLAERGIRQFVHVSAGLPTHESVHGVAREIDQDARVVYVDDDPVVVAHGRAMIDDGRNTAYIVGGFCELAKILLDPQAQRLIDLEEPVAVLMLRVLHRVPSDTAHGVLTTFRSWMAPGSAMVIAHMTWEGSDPRATKAVHDVATWLSIPAYRRSRSEIEELFAGLELLAPLGDPANWPATEPVLDRKLRSLVGVGILTG
ncbi:MAG: SAM-dependent methyltransferase [Actinomadura sp.]